jgi:hypothetical protein
MRLPRFVLRMLQVLGVLIVGVIVVPSGSMTKLSGPVLAVTLMAQNQGRDLEGNVVDAVGKPVVGTMVVFYVPALWRQKLEPVEVRTTTDVKGQFRLVTPSLRGLQALYAQVWADRPVASHSPSHAG